MKPDAGGPWELRDGAPLRMLVAAIAAITAVTLAVSVSGGPEVSRAASILYVLPIVLVSVEFGLSAGLAAAAAAAALLIGTMLADAITLGLEASAARLVAFFTTAALAGSVADALHRHSARLWEVNMLLGALANRDDLTGLGNRRSFRSDLREHLQGGKRCGAVLAIDVDRLKTVNDNLGHDAGDELLVNVANKLRAHLDPDATIARLGGDEFAVLLAEADRRTAELAAMRLTADLKGTSVVTGESVAQVGTASIGVAVIDRRTTVEALMREADAALYEAKALGGGCIAIVQRDQAAP